MSDDLADIPTAAGSFEEPQWTQYDGAWGTVEAVCRQVREQRLQALSNEEAPKVLYDKAPAEYIRLALPELAGAVEQLQWAIRMLADEATARRLVPQRELATLAGVSFSTVQRWAKSPAMTIEGGYFGPGTLRDDRRTVTTERASRND